ncbi:MAG: hypothetical protein Q7O12_04125 [Deltaproteobacteria bacterium]|nr:hypothetical protein [Deltaproteobacteria bacterium]
MKNLQKIFYGLALIFIPLAIILDKIGGVPQPLLFFLAAVAIFPLAALLVHSTEQLATYTGDTIGGLLNATFGNAPELIIALVALKAGLYDMVKASIIGAILANMLLALGAAFFCRRVETPRPGVQPGSRPQLHDHDAAGSYQPGHSQHVP